MKYGISLMTTLGATIIAILTSTHALANPEGDSARIFRAGEYERESRDVRCRIERNWKNGEYKEVRRCARGEKRRATFHTPAIVDRAVALIFPPWGRSHPRRNGSKSRTATNAAIVQCSSENVDRIVGELPGAGLGRKVGKQRAAGASGGGVAGALIGGGIGQRIGPVDQACIGQALEYAPAGQRIEWPAAGGDGPFAVVPGRIVSRNGKQCRPYEAQVRIDGSLNKALGTACRRADGVWVQAVGAPSLSSLE